MALAVSVSNKTDHHEKTEFYCKKNGVKPLSRNSLHIFLNGKLGFSC